MSRLEDRSSVAIEERNEAVHRERVVLGQLHDSSDAFGEVAGECALEEFRVIAEELLVDSELLAFWTDK